MAAAEEHYYIPKGLKFIPPKRFIVKGKVSENGRPVYDEVWKESQEFHNWYEDNKRLRWPEPDNTGSRARGPDEKPDLKNQFPSGLQVIFKLVNIHLTPEKPKYDGGVLRTEGALNERIVAIALYYYDMDNITESRVAFAHEMSRLMFFDIAGQTEQSDLTRWLGTQDESDEEFEGDEELSYDKPGSVVARTGRMVAFPNAFHYQEKPFRLQDPTRPGHQKVLAMFLVDPSVRILSTSVVPPQRKDWWAREVRKIVPFSKIPQEIFDIIIDFVEGFPMSWEQALKIRNKKGSKWRVPQVITS
ncbi:hypothetical protein M426DRAFT_17054 [Hypoxylon sp. CI-4A]|nr:hypothetical protein M426DRAFT_17054 [Hypoxylon sp. CI-4A]